MKKILMMLVLAGAMTNLKADNFENETSYIVSTGIKNISGKNLVKVEIKFKFGLKNQLTMPGKVLPANRITDYANRGAINTHTLLEPGIDKINLGDVPYSSTYERYHLSGSESYEVPIDMQRPEIVGFRVTFEDGTVTEYPVSIGSGAAYNHVGCYNNATLRLASHWHFLILPGPTFVQVPEILPWGGVVTNDGYIIQNGSVKQENTGTVSTPPSGKNATVDTNGNLLKDANGNPLWV